MIQRTASKVRNYFPEREEGQGMVEYGLIIALVAVVAIAGLIILGPKIASMFTSLGSSV
ncbi:MAG: Pilus assembly protein [Chloroflexi bacterium]|nr:Pilus assembly protein [Chloroflexota bacterium]